MLKYFHSLLYLKKSRTASYHLGVVKYKNRKFFLKWNKQVITLYLQNFLREDKYRKRLLHCYVLPFRIAKGFSLIFSFTALPTYKREMKGETKECYVDDCHKSMILLII